MQVYLRALPLDLHYYQAVFPPPGTCIDCVGGIRSLGVESLWQCADYYRIVVEVSHESCNILSAISILLSELSRQQANKSSSGTFFLLRGEDGHRHGIPVSPAGFQHFQCELWSFFF